MTRNPPSMAELGEYVTLRLGGENFLGIIGDSRHFNGYHLGSEDVPSQDYSLTTDRDIAGARLGNYASAIDIGMSWDGSRQWLVWLIKNARAGVFPDLVEINGSVDGGISYYLNAEDGFEEPPIAGVDHVGHTHLGFYRDSIYRSQLAVLELWPPKTSTTSRSPEPRPVISGSPLTPRDAVHVLSWKACAVAAGLGALTWFVRRRMEMGRENS